MHSLARNWPGFFGSLRMWSEKKESRNKKKNMKRKNEITEEI